MNAKIIDGKHHAAKLRIKISNWVANLKCKYDVTPGLAVVLVGHDPASEIYVRNKHKFTIQVGMNSFEHKLPVDVRQYDLLALIEKLNTDPTVHGILCQLPLPPHLDESIVINAIVPTKDVDGFHISNVGLLNTNQKAMIPCTPLGCLMLLRAQLGNLSGLHAVVIGRSNIVGKPMANMLLCENCTVTIVHSRTKNIKSICRMADIIVAAVGRAQMIKNDWVGDGATVIDVGINRINDTKNTGKTRLVGDVDFADVCANAAHITPVPGGVGPMTIACLLANTFVACCRAHGLKEPTELTL